MYVLITALTKIIRNDPIKPPYLISQDTAQVYGHSGLQVDIGTEDRMCDLTIVLYDHTVQQVGRS